MSEQSRSQFLRTLIIVQLAYTIGQFGYSGLVLFQSSAEGRGIVFGTIVLLSLAYVAVLRGLWREKRWACLCFIALSTISASSPDGNRWMTIIDGFQLMVPGAIISLSLLGRTWVRGVPSKMGQDIQAHAA